MNQNKKRLNIMKCAMFMKIDRLKQKLDNRSMLNKMKQLFRKKNQNIMNWNLKIIDDYMTFLSLDKKIQPFQCILKDILLNKL